MLIASTMADRYINQKNQTGNNGNQQADDGGGGGSLGVQGHGKDAIYIAAEQDSMEKCNAAIKAGANIDYLCSRSYMDKDGKDCGKGFSSLHVACIRGSLPFVTRLLESNANVDINAENGRTPLYVASWKGHHPVVEALLQHGAAADYMANNGETPLSVTLSKGKLDVVKLLRYFTEPTSEHSVTMANLLLKEMVVYLDFLSIIELFEMLGSN